MSRGRLTAYLRYQLGDYLLQRASIPLILVLFVAGLPLWSALRGQPDFFRGPRGTFIAMQLYTTTVALFLPLGAFLAGAGIISTDRQQGFIRFFFSKPISANVSAAASIARCTEKCTVYRPKAHVIPPNSITNTTPWRTYACT